LEPDSARTLRLLARHQGVKVDEYTEESGRSPRARR